MPMQNYFYGLVMMLITGVAFTALFLPPPFSFIFFMVVTYGGNISFIVVYPKLTRLIGNWHGNVIWIRVLVSELAAWVWPPFTFQLWYDNVPHSIEIKDAFGNFVEWLHLLPLKDAIRHPKYNDGRPIWEIAFKSGEYSIRLPRGVKLTADEIREATSWSKLVVKKRGIAFYLMMVGEHKSVDFIDGEELVPTVQELRLAETSVQEGKELLNNIPIVRHSEKGGVYAIPVIKMLLASGSVKVADEIAKTHPILQEPLFLRPELNGEGKKTIEEMVIRAKRRGTS